MNLCIHSGRLGRDPEVRYGANGNAVATFSLAVDKSFHKEGESKVDFFNYVAFGKSAEFVEKYLKQGTKVLVTSESYNDEYTNKETNKKTTYTKFRVNKIEFAESKASGEKKAADDFMTIANDTDLEELPFN